MPDKSEKAKKAKTTDAETVEETETPAEADAGEPEAAVEAEPMVAEVEAEAAVEEEPAEVAAAVEEVAVEEVEPIAAEAESIDADAVEPAAEVAADVEEPAPAAPAEDIAEAEAAPAPTKKKKRLPRSLRPQRTRTKRQKPTERKPITRLPKPEHQRGRRQERQGRVVSASADKTIVVRVDVAKVHPMYKKVVKRSSKFHAHDEENQAKVGDIVRIVETRPVSRLKRWRLQEIVEAAK